MMSQILQTVPCLRVQAARWGVLGSKLDLLGDEKGVKSVVPAAPDKTRVEQLVV